MCSVLAAPILLKQPWKTQDTKNVTPQETPTETPQTTPQATATPFQNTLSTTPKNTPPQQASFQTTPQTPVQLSNRTLFEAIGNATSYLKGTSEPYALLWLNMFNRRFNITLFADSLQRYDQALAQSDKENQPLMRVFRRIADYNNILQDGDLQTVTAETDKLTVPALYCNRYGLSSNYAVTLAQAASSHDYMVTHALLATIWIHENGYDLPMPAGFYEALYHANAALINTDAVVTDIELEAATFLYLAGQDSMVNHYFIQNVIAAQNSDGGWRTTNAASEDSNWHSSTLALMLLLHEEYPAASYPPMLAPT
jgi:hypothetical protein